MIRTGPRFTEAARAAAAQKRRERAAIKADTKSDFEVFVLRSETEPHRYDWEIRQFGGVVVKRSEQSFTSSAQARTGGMMVLPTLAADRAKCAPLRSRSSAAGGSAGREVYG